MGSHSCARVAHAHSCAEGYENESLTPKTTGRIQKKCL